MVKDNLNLKFYQRACRLAQCVKAGMQKMGKKKNSLLPFEDQHPSKITEEEVNMTRASMPLSSSPHMSKQVCVISTNPNSAREGSQSVKCMRIAVITTTPSRTKYSKKEDHVNSKSPKGPWVGHPEELNIPTLTVTSYFIPEKLSTTLNLAADAVVPKITKQIIEPLISVSSFIASSEV